MLTHKSFCALALALVCAGSLAAQGIVIDRRIGPMPRPQPRLQQIEIRSHQVETVIDGQSATTTITQTFHNPNQRQLEGEYIFPLPPESAVSDFEMTMNGEMVKGELLDAAKARQIYVETVRRMIDPGLLEYAGRGMFKARVFPILPQDDLTIKFSYTELLEYDSGLVRFHYPLRTRGFSPTPLQSVGVKVTLKAEQELRTIYSPTHTCEIVRNGDNEAVIGLELSDQQPKNDFELYYGFADGATTANVLSYRESDDAGYFMALLTPKLKLAPEEILPKDVIVVLDTSGSMHDDGKIDQARKALKHMVNKLNADDRFALVTFSTTTRKYHDALTLATEDARKEALADIESIKAAGGTNFVEAITEAYGLVDGEAARPCYIVVLSDGVPTVGETTNVKEIAKLARERRADNVRMFPFGVGNDVNTWLLDTLAEENRGQREYVKPNEEMEMKVSNFADKIASPVLADVSVKIDGAKIHDLHPQVPGDLFAGSQISLLGRFDKPGTHTLMLEGTVNGEKRAFEYVVELGENNTEKAYLPRMWAVRRVGYLMDQVNLKGETKEIKDEIVRLGTKFGIVTPYTSFLVIEDEPLPQPGAEMPRDRREGRVIGERGGPGIGGGVPAAPEQQKGEDAVGRSKSNADRRAQDSADGAEEVERDSANELEELARKKGFASRRDARKRKLKEAGYSDEAASHESAEIVKTIGTRSFVWTDGVWLESDLTNAELFGAEAVDYLSERYFELMDAGGNVAKVLALGNEVIFRHGKGCVRIVDRTDQAGTPGENGDESGEDGKEG